LGFNIPWSSDELAYLYAGNCGFLLRDIHGRTLVDPFMLHLLVEDVASWWQRVTERNLPERYGLRAEPPGDRPWGVREFELEDTSGVIWRIGTSVAQLAT
ncbi:MAG TPA: glyoxalase, partial [Gammaproteobacteria bacterium]|nr:glyoxalase [Gammaproteobacteria bacterium]